MSEPLPASPRPAFGLPSSLSTYGALGLPSDRGRNDDSHRHPQDGSCPWGVRTPIDFLPGSSTSLGLRVLTGVVGPSVVQTLLRVLDALESGGPRPLIFPNAGGRLKVRLPGEHRGTLVLVSPSLDTLYVKSCRFTCLYLGRIDNYRAVILCLLPRPVWFTCVG